MSHPNADRFKSNAGECRQMAHDAETEAAREAWLRLAAEWDKLAEQARNRRGIFNRYE